MHPSGILHDLKTLFSEKLHIEVPAADTDLIASGLLDSLQLVELLLHIETDLGFRVPLGEIDLDDLRSISRIAGLVAAHTEFA